MQDDSGTHVFPSINRAYDQLFKPGVLSLGLTLPIENNMHAPVPTLERHIERAQMAEALGFSALWLRDVPFNVPSFGDAGQTFDPFVYLGVLAAQTSRIALGVASIILPLRHPAHVAKAGASADVLSGGRLLMGIASGDRPEEYPALNMSYPDRSARFRDSYAYIRSMGQNHPRLKAAQGVLDGHIDMLPKPTGPRIPLLLTGGCQQTPEWVAAHGDGWITYPRSAPAQARVVRDYRAKAHAQGEPEKPVIQSLYIDLVADPNAPPQSIHLGFRSGTSYLLNYLSDLKGLGINHVALNLRFNRAEIEPTLSRLAEDVLPVLTANNVSRST